MKVPLRLPTYALRSYHHYKDVLLIFVGDE